MLKILRKTKCVLIDISGTIHIENSEISGSIDALQRLRQCGDVQVKFVTNTTKESKQTLLNRLQNIGFSIHENEIFTSLSAANLLIQRRNLNPFFLLSDDAKKDFQSMPKSNVNLDAVVVGLSPLNFHYENMTKAMRLLLNGAQLIAIHKARYYKRDDGLAIGPGAYVAALEFSTGVKAEVVGKPEVSFFEAAVSEINCTLDQILMIGDDAKDDIEGALKAGMQACLVKTGKYRPNDEFLIEPKPTFVAENFAEAVDVLLKSRLETDS